MSGYRRLKRLQKGAVIGLALLIMHNASSVYGESSEVIYQGQNTVSTQPYYSALKQKKQPKNQEGPARLRTGQALTLEGRLPIESKRLTPAEPSVVDVERLVTPVFVMGSDVQSIHWLQQNGEVLAALGAMGIVAELRDMSAWREIQALGEHYGLRLNVLNGDAIAEAFNIEHYPVLIQEAQRGG